MAHPIGYLRRVLCFALLSLAAFGVMWGQTAPAAGPSVRFTVFSAKPITELTYVSRIGGPPQKVVFQPTARSVRYEYRGPMPIRFVDATEGVAVAEAVIPAGMTNALLLFSPLEKAQGAIRYQVAVLDDSAARQGPGGLAIINLSGLTLEGTINDQKITLKAGLNPPVAVTRAAKVALTTVFKNRIYQSYTGNVTLGRNERALMILFPPFRPGALEVQSRVLLDQPPGSAPAPAPASAAQPKRTTK